ncbi:macrophage mannose receptor 1-like [Amia ocellicauda]|uniref:macrophage mannose receptor 1-like n=1 Tax=Amia ocellicauda TaxID=2972642 RepID=UPI003464E7EB
MEKTSLTLLLLAGLCQSASCLMEFNFYVEALKSWADAQNYCRQNYKNMSSVESEEELQQLLLAARGTTMDSAWIGLYSETPNWQWSSGEPVDFFSWRRRCYCAIVNQQGFWDDKNCFETHPFMCYDESPNNNQSYTMINDIKNWPDARQYCRSHHTDLVTIDSRTENEALVQIAGGSVFWVGLYNEPWYWSDGSNTRFWKWGAGEPNGCQYGHNCFSFDNNGFYDQDCHANLHFWCCKDNGGKTLSTECIHSTQYNSPTLNQSFAYQFCWRMKKNLISIHSLEEYTMFNGMAQTVHNSWSGLHHGMESWQWVNNNSLSFSNWNTLRFCAKMDWEGYWWDVECDAKLYFMCYTETSNLTQLYTLINEARTWAEARTYCREHHTDLVTVHNQSVNQAVTQRTVITFFWIGLFNEPWKWSDGSNSMFRKWKIHQPDNLNGQEACVDLILNGIDYGTWEDQNCNNGKAFFCADDVREMILVQENKTWEEALDYCRDNYTDLTSVVSEREHIISAMQTAGAQTDHVWLGLRQSLTSGSWFWVNREPMGFNKWAAGGQHQCPKPSYCGAISTKDHLWRDRPCGLKLNFICYRD